MIELTPQADHFKKQIRESLRTQCQSCLGCRTIKIGKNRYVYTSGQRDATIYVIESGQVKLLLPTPEGKECLLAIRTAGDLIGELCLSGQIARLETAIAMKEATLRPIPIRNFLACLREKSLVDGLVQYLALRISEQQEMIAMLATVNSEQRLAKTLLHLCRILGKSGSSSIRIEQRISHEELSRMVGTTRPRICIFLKKFRELGLVGVTRERHLIIEERKLKAYIGCNGFAREEGHQSVTGVGA